MTDYSRIIKEALKRQQEDESEQPAKTLERSGSGVAKELLLEQGIDPETVEAIDLLMASRRSYRRAAFQLARDMFKPQPLPDGAIATYEGKPICCSEPRTERDTYRDAILGLISDREKLGYELAQERELLSEEELDKTLEPYLQHKTWDQEDLEQAIRDLYNLVGNKLDSDVVSAALRCDFDQALAAFHKVTQSIAK